MNIRASLLLAAVLLLAGCAGNSQPPSSSPPPLDVVVVPVQQKDVPIYGETVVLDKTESKSKTDRGIVYVETKGYKQDGTVVCVFRRKVMVPKREYGEARGGEQPGRPTPAA